VRSSLPSPAPRGGSWRRSRSTRGRSACGSSRHCRSACAALQARACPSSTDGAQPVEEQGNLRPVLPFLPRGVRRQGQPGGASLPSPTAEEQGRTSEGWGRGETGRQGTQRRGTEGDRDRDLQVGPTCRDGRKIRAETVLALILGRDYYTVLYILYFLENAVSTYHRISIDVFVSRVGAT
jgi:hypothetical protein